MVSEKVKYEAGAVISARWLTIQLPLPAVYVEMVEDPGLPTLSLRIEISSLPAEVMSVEDFPQDPGAMRHPLFHGTNGGQMGSSKEGIPTPPIQGCISGDLEGRRHSHLHPGVTRSLTLTCFREPYRSIEPSSFFSPF